MANVIEVGLYLYLVLQGQVRTYAVNTPRKGKVGLLGVKKKNPVATCVFSSFLCFVCRCRGMSEFLLMNFQNFGTEIWHVSTVSLIQGEVQISKDSFSVRLFEIIQKIEI